jgi:diguanylate cyclase (GGDEF)-like protein
MEGKRLLIFSEISLYVIFSIILFLFFAFFDPLTPLKFLIKKLLPFWIIIFFLFFLSFRVIENYYSQILQVKKMMGKMDNFLYKLSSDLKIEKLLQNTLEILTEFYKGDISILVILDEKLKKFTSTDILTINLPNILKEIEIEKNYTYITFSPNKISIKEEELVKNFINEYGFNKCKGIITLPLFDTKKTKAIAIIGLLKKSKKEIMNEFKRTKEIVEIFLSHLNLEIENSLLHEELNITSITDPLTELYNRRYFNLRLKEEFLRAKREGYPFAIMISDLDNFKKYVDKFGHPLGDIILKELANVVKLSLRATDIICRFGGDEFSYILPFSTSQDAKVVAERIKKNVQNFKFLKENVDEEVHITLSIGIASFPEHGSSEIEILAKADNALFMAKSMGKNGIIIYEEKGG